MTTFIPARWIAYGVYAAVGICVDYVPDGVMYPDYPEEGEEFATCKEAGAAAGRIADLWEKDARYHVKRTYGVI